MMRHKLFTLLVAVLLMGMYPSSWGAITCDAPPESNDYSEQNNHIVYVDSPVYEDQAPSSTTQKLKKAISAVCLSSWRGTKKLLSLPGQVAHTTVQKAKNIANHKDNQPFIVGLGVMCLLGGVYSFCDNVLQENHFGLPDPNFYPNIVAQNPAAESLLRASYQHPLDKNLSAQVSSFLNETLLNKTAAVPEIVAGWLATDPELREPLQTGIEHARNWIDPRKYPYAAPHHGWRYRLQEHSVSSRTIIDRMKELFREHGLELWYPLECWFYAPRPWEPGGFHDTTNTAPPVRFPYCQYEKWEKMRDSTAHDTMKGAWNTGLFINRIKSENLPGYKRSSLLSLPHHYFEPAGDVTAYPNPIYDLPYENDGERTGFMPLFSLRGPLQKQSAAHRFLLQSEPTQVPLAQSLPGWLIRRPQLAQKISGFTASLRSLHHCYEKEDITPVHEGLTQLLYDHNAITRVPIVCSFYLPPTTEKHLNVHMEDLSCEAVPALPDYGATTTDHCKWHATKPIDWPEGKNVLMLLSAHQEVLDPPKFYIGYHNRPKTPHTETPPTVKTWTPSQRKTPTLKPALASQTLTQQETGSRKTSRSATLDAPVPVVDLRTLLGNETLYEGLVACRNKLLPYYTYDGFWSTANSSNRVHGQCPTGHYPFMNQTWPNTTNFLLFDQDVMGWDVVLGSIPEDEPWAGSPLPYGVALITNFSTTYASLAPAAQFSVLDHFLNVSWPEGIAGLVGEMAEGFEHVCGWINPYQVTGWENEGAFLNVENIAYAEFNCGGLINFRVIGPWYCGLSDGCVLRDSMESRSCYHENNCINKYTNSTYTYSVITSSKNQNHYDKVFCYGTGGVQFIGLPPRTFKSISQTYMNQILDLIRNNTYYYYNVVSLTYNERSTKQNSWKNICK